MRVNILDAAGGWANDKFGILAPRLSGLNAVDGTGLLLPSSNGSAVWTIIPSEDAAPTGPTPYRVGGTLSYDQGGRSVTIPLEPALLTVQPDAALDITYFHQRDVFSDDPFTEQVEPSQPFYLGVMVRNRGAGAAHNLTLTAPQPTIVENEKGLLIAFSVVSAQINGQALAASLNANFGDVAPGSQAVGVWGLSSTLQGQFTSFSARFQHMDGLGDTRLSVFKSVTVKEMTRLVRAGRPFDDDLPDFLVNDNTDTRHLPDTLYLSDGGVYPVAVVESGAVDAPPTANRLTAQLTTSLPAGWAYLRIPDPADGQFRLKSVRRSDGTNVLADNFWVTDRTFLEPGKRPVRENILHLLDYNSTGSYTLTYEPLEAVDTTPPTSAVAALPARSPNPFPVQWSGSDDSGKPLRFDVLVSVDDSPFTPWLQATYATTALYPGQTGHRYAFYSTATDATGNREAPHTTPDAQTIADLTNTPPTLIVGASQVVDEGTTVSIANTATDPDLPGQTLTYSLRPDKPLNAAINRNTGLLTWPTTEADGPGTNILAIIVTDNGLPPSSATGFVSVVVREVNTAPVLAVITNRTINEGFMLFITNRVTDLDLPPNQFSYSLGANAPAGAAINATNGIFRWQPTETQGPSTNTISVIVTDNGVPPLSATQQFTVMVRDALSDFTLAIGSTNLFLGESNIVPLTLGTGVELTGVRFALEADASRLADLQWVDNDAVVGSTSFQSTGPNRWQCLVSAKSGQTFQGAMTLAQLRFVALTNAHSAIVPVHLLSADGLRPDGTVLPNPGTFGGRLFLVGPEPLLDINREPVLTLYGHPGTTCGLQYRTNLSFGGSWTEFIRFTLTSRSQRLTNAPALSRSAFYRAFELRPFSLGIQSSGGPLFALTLQGQPGAHYWLQTATSLSVPIPWTDLFPLVLTNTTQSFLWTNFDEAQRIFRARQE